VEKLSHFAYFSLFVDKNNKYSFVFCMHFYTFVPIFQTKFLTKKTKFL